MIENFILTEFTELFLLRFPWLGVAWLTCLGGCLGSFLNVVVYRMPAGLNIAYPASRCPKCETPIRGPDNIPVISWLVLRGRCRACGVEIDARYPKVEAFVALTFGLMAYFAVLSAQFNSENANRIALLLSYFVSLQFALTGMFLIHFDRHPIPKSLTIFFVCYGIFFPLATSLGVESWNSYGEHFVSKLLWNFLGAIAVGVSLARFSSSGDNLLAISLVGSAFRGMNSILYAGILTIVLGYLCRKTRWIYAFLFSAIIGLDATYYILNESSLVEFVPKQISRPLGPVLIVLFSSGLLSQLAVVRSKQGDIE